MKVSRAITPFLVPSSRPVLVLEGPRTSGKTYVARQLVDTGVWDRFESLADPASLAIAGNDPAGWLASLPAHTVIDEAQLLPDVSLYIKALVDSHPERRFLLTGSAHLARTGLGGSDPLTGRVRRWRLSPMTEAELGGRPEKMSTLVDELFSRDILLEAASTVATRHGESQSEWMTLVKRGGFPLLALGTVPPREADQWVRDTTASLLSDDLLPSERFDVGLARRVLDAILRLPGDILNITALGQRVGLDSRTVDRYLDIMEERFLLTFLPNLATNPTRQTRARSKVHAVDTAFACESLRRANPTTLSEQTLNGHLFESFVVNQILPCLQFSRRLVQAYYWREAKTNREVDLVLADSEGDAVGVEVKASSHVTLGDARGLLAMSSRIPLVASYVVYTGDRVIRLEESVWALPVGMLWGDGPGMGTGSATYGGGLVSR